MQPPYDAALREAVRLRMSAPNRESVAEIARDAGITEQTIYNWRSQWQKQGQLVPATNRPPEQWSAADKLAAVIQCSARRTLSQAKRQAFAGNVDEIGSIDVRKRSQVAFGKLLSRHESLHPAWQECGLDLGAFGDHRSTKPCGSV
jgi:transposase-like protein